MKILAAVIVLLSLSESGAWAGEHEAYKMPRSHVIPIIDGATDRQYELYIKLPEDYDKNTDTIYPVIYATDAIWHMDMLSGATEYLMPNVIVVGISWQTDLEDERTHVSRFRDYSFLPSTNPEHQARYQFGQASQHLSFIQEHVIPYVEAHYRTNPSKRTYFGYSLGGEFGTYVLLADPAAFKYYIMGSPSLRAPDIKYLDELEARTAPDNRNTKAHAFISIGELEGDQIGVNQELMSLLERRSNAGLSLTGLEIIEASDHGTAFPETVIRAVKWLSGLNSK